MSFSSSLPLLPVLKESLESAGLEMESEVELEEELEVESEVEPKPESESESELELCRESPPEPRSRLQPSLLALNAAAP